LEDEDGDRLIYLGGGPLAALLLGVALVPLRGVTTASNFTFAFMALTILVAELGGRGAALATALSSSLSLDFFLTEPYRRLAIEDKHDVIAFAGLTVCGLIAAAVGSQRGERVAALHASRARLELARAGLHQLERGGVPGPGLAGLLEAARGALPLEGALVRDGRGQVLAATVGAHALPVPDRSVPAAGLPERGAGRPLPREGARLQLLLGTRPVGSLDVWGDGRPASAGARTALWDLARVLALVLAGSGAGGGVAAGTSGLPETASRA
jgi:hypothetical protein